MPPIDEILQSVFCLQQFRPHQREIISDVLGGHDVVCVMPTGAGKSLCFQLPAVVLRGLTIIVSPLISLMSDQVQHLRKLRIPALYLNSSLPGDEQRQLLSRLWNGFRGLLYIAPERFSAPSFQKLIPKLRPNLFVVDEAHCVSFWGHDFRPEYMKLAEVRRQLGSPVTMAVTATATPQVRHDMVQMLGLRAPKLHVTGFDRPNLTYSCRRFERMADKDAALLRFLDHRAGSGIVYCSTRKAVEELSALFEEEFPDRTICAYHAGMNAVARARSQAQFMKDEDAIGVATNAFGMGINKPDIRFVVHYNLPGSVEAYYQEAGRAGRDGKPAACVLYFNNWDLRTQEYFIENIGENNAALTTTEVTRLQKHARRKLDLMLSYATTVRCRRRQILDYFGESTPVANCGCDVCASTSFHRYQPDNGKPSVRLRLPDAPPKRITLQPTQTQSASIRKRSAPPTNTVQPLNAAADLRLLALKEVRSAIAKKNKWPAYCVLHDSVLREVARQAPKTVRELAAIKGVGEKRAASFGAELLAAIRK